jgi:hypothetical protein
MADRMPRDIFEPLAKLVRDEAHDAAYYDSYYHSKAEQLSAFTGDKAVRATNNPDMDLEAIWPKRLRINV